MFCCFAGLFHECFLLSVHSMARHSGILMALLSVQSSDLAFLCITRRVPILIVLITGSTSDEHLIMSIVPLIYGHVCRSRKEILSKALAQVHTRPTILQIIVWVSFLFATTCCAGACTRASGRGRDRVVPGQTPAPALAEISSMVRHVRSCISLHCIEAQRQVGHELMHRKSSGAHWVKKYLGIPGE